MKCFKWLQLIRTKFLLWIGVRYMYVGITCKVKEKSSSRNWYQIVLVQRRQRQLPPLLCCQKKFEDLSNAIYTKTLFMFPSSEQKNPSELWMCWWFMQKSLNDWNWVFCLDENTSLREVIRNEYIANTLLNVFA